jgi:hypothetical protein
MSGESNQYRPLTGECREAPWLWGLSPFEGPTSRAVAKQIAAERERQERDLVAQGERQAAGLAQAHPRPSRCTRPPSTRGDRCRSWPTAQ